ncbi:MAG: hypothetical protein AB1898_00930 [Acidobacteriota bacterium]
MLISSFALVAACGGGRQLSQDTVKKRIQELSILQIKDKKIQVQRIEQTDQEHAVAEADLKLAFKFSKTAGADWQIEAIRLGDRDWLDMDVFLEALDQVRSGNTKDLLGKLVDGCQRYRQKDGSLPRASDIVKLTDLLVPEFMAEVIRYDAWNHELQVREQGTSGLEIRSAGPDGNLGTADDIVAIVSP